MVPNPGLVRDRTYLIDISALRGDSQHTRLRPPRRPLRIAFSKLPTMRRGPWVRIT